MEGMLEIVSVQVGDHLSSRCVSGQLCWRIETNFCLVGVLLASSNQAKDFRVQCDTITTPAGM